MTVRHKQMSQSTINVIVESLPSNIYSDLLPWIVGIVLPISLFYVSKTFSGNAEKNANEFTIKLYKEERIHLQKIRATELLNEIYKATYNLSRIGKQIKKHEKISKMFLDVNDKIIGSGNETAIILQQENIRMTLLRDEELGITRVDNTININSAIGLLSTIIGDSEVKNLQVKVSQLPKQINDENGITEDLVNEITDEINTLSDRIVKGLLDIELH